MVRQKLIENIIMENYKQETISSFYSKLLNEQADTFYKTKRYLLYDFEHGPYQAQDFAESNNDLYENKSEAIKKLQCIISNIPPIIYYDNISCTISEHVPNNVNGCDFEIINSKEYLIGKELLKYL